MPLEDFVAYPSPYPMETLPTCQRSGWLTLSFLLYRRSKRIGFYCSNRIHLCVRIFTFFIKNSLEKEKKWNYVLWVELVLLFVFLGSKDYFFFRGKKWRIFWSRESNFISFGFNNKIIQWCIFRKVFYDKNYNKLFCNIINVKMSEVV